MATELARNIKTTEEVLTEFGVSPAEYNEISRTRQFRNMLEDAIKEWGAASNTAERVKLKSMHVIEQAMPAMYEALVDKDQNLNHRAALFGTIAKIGGLGNPAPVAQSTGEQFSITINMGKAEPVVIKQDLPTRVIDMTDYEEL